MFKLLYKAIVACNVLLLFSATLYANKNFHSLQIPPIKVGDTIYAANSFKIVITNLDSINPNFITGKGVVNVSWLDNLEVQFEQISIDAKNTLISGAIFTVVDDSQKDLQQLIINRANSAGTAQFITAKINTLTNSYLPKVAANIINSKVKKALSPKPLKLPLGLTDSLASNIVRLGILEMAFGVNEAYLTAVAAVNTNGFFASEESILKGTNQISFIGQKIVFNNNGTLPKGTMKLAEPIIVNTKYGNDDYKITFDTATSIGKGNYFDFDYTNTNSNWKYSLDVKVQIPKSILTDKKDKNKAVIAQFTGNADNFKNIILQATIPACNITAADGLGFATEKLIFDNSELENAKDMKFPEKTGNIDTSVRFVGFYAKELSITLPDYINASNNLKPISFGCQNMIIEQGGFTGKLFSNNIFEAGYPNVNLGNLSASIDTVNIALLQNSVTKAYFTGTVTLPITDTVKQGVFYNCLVKFGKNSELLFNLKSIQPINAPFLANSTISIANNSVLKISVAPKNGSFDFISSINLNGDIKLPIKVKPTNGTVPIIDLTTTAKFQNLKLAFNYVNSNSSVNFDPGIWAFASPQKKIFNFPFTILSVTPISKINTNSKYLYEGGININTRVNIGSTNCSIAANADLKLTAALINRQGYLSNTKLATLKPEFLGLEVNNVSVKTTTPFGQINGLLNLFTNDPIYGNGFKGELDADFRAFSATLKSSAAFGYKINPDEKSFNYWMVQGQVMAKPGFIFMPGFAIRGIGLGAYYKMRMSEPATMPTTISNTFNGATFTPDDNIFLGLKAKAIIATTPKDETFNSAVGISAEFNNNGGINFFKIDGQFKCGAELGNNADNGFLNGGVNVKYDFVNKIFDLNADAKFDAAPINIKSDGYVNAKLNVNGKDNLWSFKMGTPTAANTIKVIGVNVDSYLMFGNNLGNDVPKGFMPRTINGFRNSGLTIPTFIDNATKENKYKTASGFAIGASINYSIPETEYKPLKYVKFKYQINAGGEINASLLQYNRCQGFKNGWRAQTGAACYINASLKYEVEAFTKNFNGTLVSLQAGAMVQAEFPNSTYLAGSISSKVNILNFIKFDFNKAFVYGNKCGGEEIRSIPNTSIKPLNFDTLKGNFVNAILPIFDDLDSSESNSFKAVLNYEHESPFEISEPTSPTELRYRNFRVSYSGVIRKVASDFIKKAPPLVKKLRRPLKEQGKIVDRKLIAGEKNLKDDNDLDTDLNSTNKFINPLALQALTNRKTVVTTGNMDEWPLLITSKDEFGATTFNTNKVLNKNTAYALVINAILQEQDSNGNWQDVTNVSETKQIYFSTK